MDVATPKDGNSVEDLIAQYHICVMQEEIPEACQDCNVAKHTATMLAGLISNNAFSIEQVLPAYKDELASCVKGPEIVKVSGCGTTVQKCRHEGRSPEVLQALIRNRINYE